MVAGSGLPLTVNFELHTGPGQLIHTQAKDHMFHNVLLFTYDLLQQLTNLNELLS